jgi:uncharacterized damage-inducible protein DinB
MNAKRKQATPKKGSGSKPKSSKPRVPLASHAQTDAIEDNFPPGVARPALRALVAAGISDLDQLTRVSEAELSAMHGMGPKAIQAMRDALMAKGLAFRRDVVGHSNLIDAYVHGIQPLIGAVHGLSPEDLRVRIAPGTWSILEVLCHLADSETLFSERMKRVLIEDRPPLLFADPDRYIAALAYHQRDAWEELAVIHTARNQMARILRAQRPEAWDRVGVHSKEGERTLEQLVRKAVDHLEHHLVFVRGKRMSLENKSNQSSR